MTKPNQKQKKEKVKRVKAYAIVSRGNVLIGGGEKLYGYTPLCVYRTRQGAKNHISLTRPNDKVVPCEITYKI